ncbi:hypothetical protein F404_gp020 [Vibrio phage pVp-1]|uniref:Uncharacterized protein n=1 Tax=Vibrio phage pVp-1 TaxID=1150989 RepID=H6WXB1_9CAUD|nr:hypothetical protein F404_gp020 [Vibrio phage pVp-1]AFB83877.1 hypothetical protein pVp-1_0020 [Vibrio phage pVp-1]QQO38480.1 hypothetical protein VPG01_122 [Vibrio phage VPG01]
MGFWSMVFGSSWEYAPTLEPAKGASDLSPIKEPPKPRPKTGAAAMMPQEVPLDTLYLKYGGNWHKYVRVDDDN